MEEFEKKSKLIFLVIKIMLILFAGSVIAAGFVGYVLKINNTAIANLCGIVAIGSITIAIICVVVSTKVAREENEQYIESINETLQTRPENKLFCQKIFITEEEHKSNPFYTGHNEITGDYQIDGILQGKKITYRLFKIGDRYHKSYGGHRKIKHSICFIGSSLKWQSNYVTPETDIVILSKDFIKLTGYHLDSKNKGFNNKGYGYTLFKEMPGGEMVYVKGEKEEQDVDAIYRIYNEAINNLKERLQGYGICVRCTNKETEVLMYELDALKYDPFTRLKYIEKMMARV